MNDQREVLTIDELARYLDVPKSTLYRLAAEGRIPSHKVGKHWRFRRESVNRWLDQPGVDVGQADSKDQEISKES
ncbi:MAG: helix-turn-helix domain-containing protein [Bryobacteraceae bacterium]